MSRPRERRLPPPAFRMENPFSVKVLQVFTGFGVGCGVGIGVGRPIYLGMIPGLQQVMSATRGATDAFSGVTRHVNSALRTAGLKNIEAGIGCGVGIGHGFGIGIALKPRVLHGIQSSVGELMNFLHETMQSPKKSTMPTPVSHRKRVAAPFGSVDRKLFILTPMPLRSGCSAVPGSGMFNNKGHGKHRREGPCVGTKGFRAPEVLLRSFHQGCKVDVWSAGVTLLYLIIGRTPFGGDPEQNIKEIAKLKGSEELWEVAKLHNCESSYPSDLFDVKFPLCPVDLREWCAANTRRPDLLEMIPKSFFNLVDKCLAVNPRCRLSSEDALRHEFFAPCHDDFRKLRIPRRSAGSDAACSSSHQNTAFTAKQS